MKDIYSYCPNIRNPEEAEKECLECENRVSEEFRNLKQSGIKKIRLYKALADRVEIEGICSLVRNFFLFPPYWEN